jgi:hypothetical protein
MNGAPEEPIHFLLNHFYGMDLALCALGGKVVRLFTLLL